MVLGVKTLTLAIAYLANANGQVATPVTPEIIGATTGNLVSYAERCNYSYLKELKQHWSKFLSSAPRSDVTLKSNAVNAYDTQRRVRYKDFKNVEFRESRCKYKNEDYEHSILSLEEEMEMYKWPNDHK